MARTVSFRKFLTFSFALVVFLQLFLMLLFYHREQDLSERRRELRHSFNNVSQHEFSALITDSEASLSSFRKHTSRQMAATTPQNAAWSLTTSLGSISNNLSDTRTTGINNITPVLNTVILPRDIKRKRTNHKINVEVDTIANLSFNENISRTTPLTLPSWIPANIINLSVSNISDIYECNLAASANNEEKANKNKLQMCPCVPDNLEKHIFRGASRTSLYKEVQAKYRNVSIGGHWSPQTCVPRHRIAIIVPYRDREDHLIMFLDYMHRLLQKQLLDYTIIIAEQGSPAVFNKAKIMNAAYMESKKIKVFDCYVFHDVDMLPEDERNLYTCPSMPRHQGVAADKFNYNLVYDSIIGGAAVKDIDTRDTPTILYSFFSLYDSRLIGGVAVYRPEHFELVNGYSNKFWGWGGEDDNMYRRIIAKKLKVLRPPDRLARYTMIKHEADKGNPYNEKVVNMVNSLLKMQDSDGLSSLKYKTLVKREKALYTWMLFDITE